MTKLLCTIPEAIKSTGVSRSFIYERMAEGHIRSVKAGRKRLIDVASLTAWVESLPTEPLNIQTKAAK